MIAERLREMAAGGSGVVALLTWLRGATSSRIQIIAALQQAFMLSAGDAAAAGAWHVFPGGTWSDEQLEQFLAPRIQATRIRWMPA